MLTNIALPLLYLVVRLGLPHLLYSLGRGQFRVGSAVEVCVDLLILLIYVSTWPKKSCRFRDDCSNKIVKTFPGSLVELKVTVVGYFWEEVAGWKILWKSLSLLEVTVTSLKDVSKMAQTCLHVINRKHLKCTTRVSEHCELQYSVSTIIDKKMYSQT